MAWSYKVRSPADSPWISETPVGYRPQVLTDEEQEQARENIGAGSGGGSSNTSAVYVSGETGNDSSGQPGNSSKPYETFDAAFDAAIAEFGSYFSILVDVGRYISRYTIVAAEWPDGVKIIGSGTASVNAAETAMSGGTIFVGTMGFNRGALNAAATLRDCEFRDFSIDVSDTSGEPESDGLAILSESTYPITGVVVENVTVLMKKTGTLVSSHGIHLVACDNWRVVNTRAYRGTYGYVIKSINGTLANYQAIHNQNDGIIVAASETGVDTYAPCYRNNFIGGNIVGLIATTQAFLMANGTHDNNVLGLTVCDCAETLVLKLNVGTQQDQARNTYSGIVGANVNFGLITVDESADAKTIRDSIVSNCYFYGSGTGVSGSAGLSIRDARVDLDDITCANFQTGSIWFGTATGRMRGLAMRSNSLGYHFFSGATTFDDRLIESGSTPGFEFYSTTGTYAVTEALVNSALGATPAASQTLTNPTAAAAGTQQVSPATQWTGQGWKTNATAASQEVAFRSYVLPVQGSANPTGTWTIQSNINGAGWTDRFTLTSAGLLTVASIAADLSGSSGYPASGMTGTLAVGSGGTGVATSGTTSQIAVGGGTGSPIVWTTATGTGAPVRASSPSISDDAIISILSTVTNGTAGSGPIGVIANSLLAGSMCYLASSSLTTGRGLDIVITGSGNGTGYGAVISSTRTGAGTSNIALQLTAQNGASANTALNVTAGTTALQATNIQQALTYGGVTLSNAVTGTGNMVLSADQTLTGTTTIAAIAGVTSITGGAGNMTITSGTGASRTMILRTTTSGSTATTAVTINADQSVDIVGDVTIRGTGLSLATFGNATNSFVQAGASRALQLGTAGSTRWTIDTTGNLSSAGLYSFTLGGAPAAATTNTKLTKLVSSIADNTATTVLTVTIPNAAHAATVRVTLLGRLGAGGTIGADEASATVSYDIGITRTAGVLAVATLSTVCGSAAAAVAGADTVTVTGTIAHGGEAVGATNTYLVKVTIAKGGGASANHKCTLMAEVLNANATGISIA